MNWLGRRSDIEPMDLVNLMKKNQVTNHLEQLVLFATQLSPRVILPKALREKAVMSLFLDHRDEVCGRRLRDFEKKTGGSVLRGWIGRSLRRTRRSSMRNLVSSACGT